MRPVHEITEHSQDSYAVLYIKNGPRRGPSFNGVCKLMRRLIETLAERQPVRSRLIRISAEATALHGRRECTQQVIVVAKIAAPEHGLESVVPLQADACVERAYLS